jgi:hypothetical protein
MAIVMIAKSIIPRIISRSVLFDVGGTPFRKQKKFS